MKKKQSGFNKILFTITLFFVVLCFMATSSWAARKVDFTMANADSYLTRLNQSGKLDAASIGQALGLSNGHALKLIRFRTDFNEVTHYRYEQTYKKVPIWGTQIVVSIDANKRAVRINGAIVSDIKKDVKSIPSGLNSRPVLKKMKEKHKDKNIGAKWFFKNETDGTFIYLDKNGKARVAYVVSFFADNESGDPSRFVHFIDARNGKVIHSFDSLNNAEGTGPGGNQKIGYYYYGTDYPAFAVSEAGGTCTMNTPNVKTVDLNHATSGDTAYSYACYENTHKEINGAYCPLNDAHFFGQVIYDMYQDWYGVPVLPIQLSMKVHYGTNHENAYWTGDSMLFGDGYTTFYPLVSLDVAAHEVSHGFTDFNSDLIYSGESGGINEAFSDMAGESAEYYMRGTTDYMCGYDIFKAPSGALRYLYDPPLDGISIDHVDDYYSGMDVHYSSGIFNKAFYLIATSSGWTTKMAFDIFVKANMDYWTPSTTFIQGGEGAMNAAVDYGYSCQDVVNAFAQVGITLVCPGPPVADFSASLTSGGAPLTTTFTDLSQAASSWSWTFGDGGTSADQNPTYTYTAMGTYTVTLTATNEFGSDVMTKTNYITVTAPQPPVADFVASATDINLNNSVDFTDLSIENPTSWSWTFEGGTPGTSTLQNPTVSYTQVGTFDVTLVATNAQGTDTETKVGYINVSEKPYCASQGSTFSMEWIAGVEVDTMNNTSGAAGYTDFTGITCNLTGGDTVNVVLTPGFNGGPWTEYWKIWIDYNDDHDFEDPGEEVFSGASTTVVTGSFTVASGIDITTRMRVTMKYASAPTPCETFSYGEVEDYTVHVIGTGNQPPTADFTFSATDLTVDFTDTSTDSDGTIVAWSWNFGDGNTSTAQNPSHTYAAGGTYNVTLTVTDDGDATDSISQGVTVSGPNTPPTADFTFTTNDLTANFTDTSTDSDGTVVAWSWNFGDGNTSTAQNPSHTYAAGGTYTVTLTVTDNDDATDSISKDVTVTAPNIPPAANFTFTTNELTANFTDISTDSDGTIVSWSWNFGDGNTSTLQNPTHTYAAGGTYTVTLTVTDNDSGTDSISKPVTVTEPGVEIFVNDITQTIIKKGSKYNSNATVTIWDTNSAPVANATVTITWSGAVSGSASGTTAANGTVSFTSDKVKSTGPFTITVNNVTHASLPYNPALNNETTDSASY